MIWVQVLLLRAAVRAAYGRGVQYHWSVSLNGRVFLTSIDWLPGQKTERDWLKPSPHFNDRLTAACDGRASVPAHASFHKEPETQLDRAQVIPLRPCAGHLPLPET